MPSSVSQSMLLESSILLSEERLLELKEEMENISHLRELIVQAVKISSDRLKHVAFDEDVSFKESLQTIISTLMATAKSPENDNPAPTEGSIQASEAIFLELNLFQKSQPRDSYEQVVENPKVFPTRYVMPKVDALWKNWKKAEEKYYDQEQNKNDQEQNGKLKLFLPKPDDLRLENIKSSVVVTKVEDSSNYHVWIFDKDGEKVIDRDFSPNQGLIDELKENKFFKELLEKSEFSNPNNKIRLIQKIRSSLSDQLNDQIRSSLSDPSIRMPIVYTSLPQIVD